MSLEAQEREAHRIAVAYANRIGRPNEAYSKSIRAERERHYTICLDRAPIAIDQIELLEVGCGSGSELERCFLLGVDPATSDSVMPARPTLRPRVSTWSSPVPFSPRSSTRTYRLHSQERCGDWSNRAAPFSGTTSSTTTLGIQTSEVSHDRGFSNSFPRPQRSFIG